MSDIQLQEEIQRICPTNVCELSYGISLAHNGNLSNTKELAEELFIIDLRHISTDSDSEVLLNILAHEISKNNQKNQIQKLCLRQ